MSIKNIETKENYVNASRGKLFAEEVNIVVDNLKALLNSTSDYADMNNSELMFAIKELSSKSLFTTSGTNDLTLVNIANDTNSLAFERGEGIFYFQPSNVNTGPVRLKFVSSNDYKYLKYKGQYLESDFLDINTVYMARYDKTNGVYILLSSFMDTTGIGGGGYNSKYITSDTLAVKDDFLTCETKGEKLAQDEVNFTVTLPSSPEDNSTILIMDGNGNAQDRPILVDANGGTIDDIYDNLTCDVNYFFIALTYNAANNNWSLGGK